MPRTMRAAVFEDFGGPEVVEVRKVPVPDPGPGEVRVKVAASAMNQFVRGAVEIRGTPGGGMAGCAAPVREGGRLAPHSPDSSPLPPGVQLARWVR